MPTKKRQNAKTKSVNLLYNFSQKQENRTNLAMILESLLVTRDRPEAVQTSWASATNACISLLTFFLIRHTAKSRLFYNNLHTHPFNGPFSGNSQVIRYQKGKTNLDFTEARDSKWQWHQQGHMQVCTLLQADNYASTPPLNNNLQCTILNPTQAPAPIAVRSVHNVSTLKCNWPQMQNCCRCQWWQTTASVWMGTNHRDVNWTHSKCKFTHSKCTQLHHLWTGIVRSFAGKNVYHNYFL